MSAVCELSIGPALKGPEFWAIPLTLSPPPRQGVAVWETRPVGGKTWHASFFTHTTPYPLTRHLSIAVAGEYEVRVHIVTPSGKYFSPIHTFTLSEAPHA